MIHFKGVSEKSIASASCLTSGSNEIKTKDFSLRSKAFSEDKGEHWKIQSYKETVQANNFIESQAPNAIPAPL